MGPTLGPAAAAAVLAEELSALEDKSLEHVDGALQAYKSRRLVRSACIPQRRAVCEQQQPPRGAAEIAA